MIKRRIEHSHPNRSYKPMRIQQGQGSCNMTLWKHSHSLQTGSGSFGSSVSKNAFPRLSKFRALSKLGKCPSAEKLSASKCEKLLCKSEMTSLWQSKNVSIKTGPWRPCLKKVKESPSKRQSQAYNSDFKIAKRLTKVQSDP